MLESVLVTGAGGFIGQTLVPMLDASGAQVFPVLRQNPVATSAPFRQRPIVRDIGPETGWLDVLDEIDTIVHLAGIAHELDSSSSPGAYRSINVEGTRQLATQAAEADVRRFIFLSSVKVLGEQTTGKPFSVVDNPDPSGDYAVSKAEAEAVLRDIEKRTRLEVVVIRPPLVYGPRVKGNLAALSSLIEKGVPIPVGAIRNQRDLISVYNLCDLIMTCIRHPAAAGKTFLACDGESLSTAELAVYLGQPAGRSARIVYVPPRLLALVAGLFGKRDAYQKVSGDLRIDMQETRELLGWQPPYSIAESFEKSFSDA